MSKDNSRKTEDGESVRGNISTSIICLMIMMVTYSAVKGQREKNYLGKLYSIISAVTIVMLLLEIIASIEYQGRPLTVIISTVYYSSLAFLGGLWTIYNCMLSLPELSRKLGKGLWYLMAPAIIYALIFLTNPFTDLIFTLSGDMLLTKTKTYSYISLFTYVLYIFINYYILSKVESKDKRKYNAKIVTLWLLMIGSAAVTQILLDEWLVVNAAFTVIFVTTYFELQHKQVNVLSSDLREMKKGKKEALVREMAEERFRIVASDSNDIVFEINLVKQTVAANENYYKTFGEEAGFDLSWEAKTVHPEDREKFNEVKRRLLKMERGVQEELRLRTQSGEYMWFMMTISAFAGEGRRISRVMGKYSDINRLAHEREELKRRAQLDAATGLYNKSATEELIGLALEENEQKASAVVIMDIDDLKMINDKLGHSEGDRAISMIASTFKDHFRSTDIIGRIGGDEFIVFLYGMSERENIKSTLSSLCRKISLLRVGGNDGYPVRCSMGVVISEPKDDFPGLYRKADRALYFVKRGSKNAFAIYEPGMESCGYEYEDADLQEQSKESPFL